MDPYTIASTQVGAIFLPKILYLRAMTVDSECSISVTDQNMTLTTSE